MELRKSLASWLFNALGLDDRIETISRAELVKEWLNDVESELSSLRQSLHVQSQIVAELDDIRSKADFVFNKVAFWEKNHHLNNAVRSVDDAKTLSIKTSSKLNLMEIRLKDLEKMVENLLGGDDE